MVLTPSAVRAQSCLGLHASRPTPTVEVVGNFYRDGITGPSTLGASVTSGALFATVQTAANTAAGESAFSFNGIGLSGGASMKVRMLDVCAGASYASGETVGFNSTSAYGIFGAAALPLPKVFGLPFSLFGVLAAESRTSDAGAGDDASDSGLAYRTGISTYPREWLGLRVFQDHAGDGARRLGFSVGLALSRK
jgi:hypothetical protein